MFKKVKSVFTYTIALATVLVANKVSAVDVTIPGGSKNLTEYITTALQVAIWAAGILSAVFIIIGGFQYITAGASKDGATKAKQTLTYAIIGLIIVLLATVIKNFAISGLGIDTVVTPPAA